MDDEPPILAAPERLFRKELFEFRTTTDPERALEWVRREEVGLFVADYRMPGMTGSALLGRVKAESPRTSRMMLTGYPGESVVLAAAEAGLMKSVGRSNPGGTRSRIRRIQIRQPVVFVFVTSPVVDNYP